MQLCAVASYYTVGMLFFEKFFSRIENVNSRELERALTGILALRIWIPRKNYSGHCVELVSIYERGNY